MRKRSASPIGTTVLAIEEDELFDVRFHSAPIYSSYVCENERGIIDKVARCMSWYTLLTYVWY